MHGREGRYLPVGFNDDPQSGLTGRPLRKVSMGNISVLGVILGYGELPVDFRRFGLNMFPAESVAKSTPRCSELVAAGRPSRDRSSHRDG